jgi:hypothetical protein
MLRFFHQIRQRLLTDNKFSKYLLYAIGEILLVVIGILIALEVNNWNEDKNRRKEEIKYLTALRTDFETAETSFRMVMSGVQEQLEHNEQLLTILSGPAGSIPNDSITGMLRKSFIDFPFFGAHQVTAYDDLVNSGKLAILRSEQLRRALSEFDAGRVMVKGFADQAAAQWARQVTEFFVRELNVSSIYGRESAVNWKHPGTPNFPAYSSTPINKRFSSDEEVLWGRELANRIAIKNISLHDTAIILDSVLQSVLQIYPLIDASLEGSQ